MSKCANKASVCRNTARKYIKGRKSPAELKMPHTWRTRPDPFTGVWEDYVVPLLQREPGLAPLTIMQNLQEKFPGKFTPGQIRTLQRRIRQWRFLNGPEREVFFPQVTEPGRRLQADWTSMNELKITIQGEAFPHLLFHAVLEHSNWHWGQRCRSESFLSLQRGLQTVLTQLGAVPAELWVDNSSTATCRLGGSLKERRFNDAFTSLCAHFPIAPHVIQVGCPNQNGNIESLNGHFKRRLDQALMLRGYRDFSTTEEYDSFIETHFVATNKLVEGKLNQELAVMKPLPPTALPDWKEFDCKVSHYSTVQIRKTTYSVPSRLIGVRLRARVYEDDITLYAGRELVASVKCQAWHKGAVIDYRHVIEHLVRKPGAFAQYRWRDCLFPTQTFRDAFDAMEQKRDRQWANKEYIHILKLAAHNSELAVEKTLAALLKNNDKLITLNLVKEGIGTLDVIKFQIQNQPAFVPNFNQYDALIANEEVA